MDSKGQSKALSLLPARVLHWNAPILACAESHGISCHTASTAACVPFGPDLSRTLAGCRPAAPFAARQRPHGCRLARGLPVSRLAEVSGVSAAYFARSFKRAFGLPPHRYLLTRRIEQAVSLLRDTELSITDIAFSTGWQSLGTFGRIFHDVTGSSPSALRVEVRAKTAELGRVPACVLKAAQRPDLGTAVLEKRRRSAKDKLAASTKEKP